MKVTDPEIIRTGERDLIDAVKEDLDWNAVREIVKNKINISSVGTTGGEIVVHDNQVAFRVDLELKLDLSLMFDRNGNHIPEEGESQGLPAASEFGSAEAEAPAESSDASIGTVPSQGAPEPEPKPEAELAPESESESESAAKGLAGDDLSPDEIEFGLDDFSAEDSGIDLDDIALADEGSAESLDDDIDEILKESREFWENKKTE